jgi:hypothetical protein
MKLRLNGWQRIGIVVSVIWFVGVWVYYYVQFEQSSQSLMLMRGEQCYAGKETEQRDCLDKAITERHSRAEYRKELPLFLSLDFGTVAFGWLSVWFGIVIMRWIRRGFA